MRITIEIDGKHVEVPLDEGTEPAATPPRAETAGTADTAEGANGGDAVDGGAAPEGLETPLEEPLEPDAAAGSEIALEDES